MSDLKRPLKKIRRYFSAQEHNIYRLTDVEVRKYLEQGEDLYRNKSNRTKVTLFILAFIFIHDSFDLIDDFYLIIL